MTMLDEIPDFPIPQARRDAMRRELAAMVSKRERPRRPFVAAGVILIAAGAISAAAYAYTPHSASVTDRGEARCYSEVSLNDGNDYTTVAQASTGKSTRPAAIDNAISTCSALWSQGFLTAGAKGINRQPDTSASHHVPQLTACVLPNGIAAVFPGPSSTCQSLSLPLAKP